MTVSFTVDILQSCLGLSFDSSFPTDQTYEIGDAKLVTSDFSIDTTNPECTTSNWNFSYTVTHEGTTETAPFITFNDPESRVFEVESTLFTVIGTYAIEVTAAITESNTITADPIAQTFNLYIVACQVNKFNEFPEDI